MRFIHCSDLHLDSKIDGLPTNKSKIRREEIVRSFERLCEYVKNNDITAVIIAGDMFDTARITLKTCERVLFAITSCPNVDFIYLSGNHDEINFINELDVVPSNLKIIGNTWSYYYYGEVCICSVVLSSINKNTVYDELNLTKDNINIVALHGQVVGYKSQESAEIISIPKLKEKNIDYLALGHIHSHTSGQIDLRGKYAYSGCLDGRGFDELGEKGFVVVDVLNGKLTTEFVPFCSRMNHEFEFNIENYSNWCVASTTLEAQLKNSFDKNSLVKVVLTGEHDADFHIDVESLSLRLNELFFFAKVKDRTKLKIEHDDYANDKSVRGEFVRVVLDSAIEEEQKKNIILLGLAALKGEEI